MASVDVQQPPPSSSSEVFKNQTPVKQFTPSEMQGVKIYRFKKEVKSIQDTFASNSKSSFKKWNDKRKKEGADVVYAAGNLQVFPYGLPEENWSGHPPLHCGVSMFVLNEQEPNALLYALQEFPAVELYYTTDLEQGLGADADSNWAIVWDQEFCHPPPLLDSSKNPKPLFAHHVLLCPLTKNHTLVDLNKIGECQEGGIDGSSSSEGSSGGAGSTVQVRTPFTWQKCTTSELEIDLPSVSLKDPFLDTLSFLVGILASDEDTPLETRFAARFCEYILHANEEQLTKLQWQDVALSDRGFLASLIARACLILFSEGVINRNIEGWDLCVEIYKVVASLFDLPTYGLVAYLQTKNQTHDNSISTESPDEFRASFHALTAPTDNWPFHLDDDEFKKYQSLEGIGKSQCESRMNLLKRSKGFGRKEFPTLRQVRPMPLLLAANGSLILKLACPVPAGLEQQFLEELKSEEIEQACLTFLKDCATLSDAFDSSADCEIIGVRQFRPELNAPRSRSQTLQIFATCFEVSSPRNSLLANDKFATSAARWIAVLRDARCSEDDFFFNFLHLHPEYPIELDKVLHHLGARYPRWLESSVVQLQDSFPDWPFFLSANRQISKATDSAQHVFFLFSASSSVVHQVYVSELQDALLRHFQSESRQKTIELAPLPS